MIVQHNSATEIKEVEKYFNNLLGCLCFGYEGHKYNLAGDSSYKYITEIDKGNTVNAGQFWFAHDSEELPSTAQEVLEEAEELLDCSRKEALDYLDGSEDFLPDSYEEAWLIQQLQGKMAHALGYDALEDHDEQGVVWVIYQPTLKRV